MSKVTIPEPVVLRTVMPNDYRYGHVHGYTASQMKAYAAAKVREALEDAAALCDRFAERRMHPTECAGAIRTLIPKEPT
ncbi:MAG: hypothetical protein WCZ87_02395 [Thiohalobacteraceae bacterium]